MPKAGKRKATDSVSQKQLLQIQQAIKGKMHRQNTAQMFICRDDLKQVWAPHALSHMFPNLVSEDWNSIREEYICVLSILIYIGWTDWSRFRPLFLRESGRDDSCLPFADLAFLETSELVFSSHQHSFTPVVIEEHNQPHIQVIKPEYRLPFMDEPESLGTGGYGSVTKRVIAPRCLWNSEDNKDNPKPTAVACKIYKNEVPSQDFKLEVGNLDFIKESLTDSKRVMKHIAAIIHGDEFMLILPFANLYNLEIFLRGGYEPFPSTEKPRKIYDFDTKFPMLTTPVKLQHAVVKEAHQLASALKWLHEDLKVFGSSDRYLAHMDLKPANVLLVGEPGDARLPVGKWMLSDFGVSTFDKATNARVLDTPSIRDVGIRFTSRGFQGSIVRGHGPYQPPEVDLDNVDGRRCDVWSLSCLLSDVLAFAIGQKDYVHKLRQARYDRLGDDYFYETTVPTTITTINDSNTKLKSSILDWWAQLEVSSAKWVLSYIKVLRGAMKPKPSDRPDIKDIVNGLSELAPSIDSQANGAPATKFPSSSPEITGDAPEQNLEGGQESIPFITYSYESDSQHDKIPDAARTSGAYGQSSSNDHLPVPTYDRRRGIPARHEEIGGQSSSKAETLNEGDANLAADAREYRQSSTADNSSPDRHTNSASMITYREGSMTTLPLPKKHVVKAVAITSSALQVAVLLKHSVHLFSIGGNEIGQPVDLLSRVEWTKIRLASPYFAVYGLGSSHEKHIEIFDSRETPPKTLVLPHDELAQDILLSDEGVFAYVYSRHVQICFVRLKSDKSVRFTEDDALIIQAKFTASGEFLCVWASGTRADHAYFFRVDHERGSAFSCGEGSYQKTNINSPTCDIWPCPNSPACIIHEAHGGTFLAQPLGQSHPQPQHRTSVGVPNALVACVVREDLLVYLKPRKIHPERLLCGFALSQGPGDQRQITGQPRDLGKADRSTGKATAIAAHRVDGKSELVLCTITGKILRYGQS